MFFAGRKVQKLQNERNSAGRAFAGLRDDRRKLNFRVKSHVFVSLDEIRRGGAPRTGRRRLPGVATAVRGDGGEEALFLIKLSGGSRNQEERGRLSAEGGRDTLRGEELGIILLHRMNKRQQSDIRLRVQNTMEYSKRGKSASCCLSRCSPSYQC